MTVNEIKKKLAASNIKDWFQSKSLVFNPLYIDYKISLTGIVAIFDYIVKQIKGFQNYESLPQELTNSLSHFVSARDIIIELVNADVLNDYRWDQAMNLITNSGHYTFPSDAPETDFLIKLNKENPNHFRAAYNFLIRNMSYINREDFTGYLMAYEFTNKEDSKIVEREETEKKSLTRLRNEFQEKLSESENHLTEYLFQSKKKADEHTEAIDKLKEEKSLSYKEWFEDTSTNFEQFNNEAKRRIEDLESLYKEKLKLEAPAKYWNQRATKLRKEGYWWLVALLACITIGVGILVWVLKRIADGTLTQLFNNTATAIKWAIALVTLISFLAYAIRVISKLTFSSFHLVRDAEEREQLTYVYLALQKEKGIDTTERHLIMQSLFSRVDTGLLKDDASPTMPGNIVDSLMKK